MVETVGEADGAPIGEAMAQQLVKPLAQLAIQMGAADGEAVGEAVGAALVGKAFDIAELMKPLAQHCSARHLILILWLSSLPLFLPSG